MKFLITGATGFIGRHLCPALERAGHRVTALSRNPASAKRVLPSLQDVFGWDPKASPPPENSLDDVDAVVHLAGESVLGRWTKAKKNAIRESRIVSTRRLIEGIENRSSRPEIMISASAIGYYGNGGEAELTEDSPPGTDFLATVCEEWESEISGVERFGVRVAYLRFGVVFGRGGGALSALLPVARWGLAGPLGSGRQWWAWVHIDDIVGLFLHVLSTNIRGPINATAPHPSRQRDLVRTIAALLRRPAFLPVPSFALKLVMGELANEFLASRRVIPKRAQDTGYRFRFPRLGAAVADLLGKR